MMPHLDGLPEGLSHDEFKRRFMGDGRAAYDDIVNEIDRRISALSLFQS